MAGGHATQAGVEFQNHVSALVAAYALAEKAFEPFGLPETAVPVRIQQEASSPVDDLVVRTSEEGFCFVNAKRSVRLSDKENSSLSDVIEQFVRQVLAMRRPSGSREWERPLDLSRDRLILATAGYGSGRLVAAASTMLPRFEAFAELPPQSEFALTEVERSFWRCLSSLVRRHWMRHCGIEIGDADLLLLVKSMRVIGMDGSNDPRATALGVIGDNVVETVTDAPRVWESLVTQCLGAARKRSALDRQTLRDVLTRGGVRLKNLPRWSHDIRRLQSLTDETLKSIAHQSTLSVLGKSNRPQTVAIKRDATTTIVERAPDSSFLVVGEPGAGKTGALFSAATQLMSGDYRVVFLSVDRHNVSTVRGLSEDIGLDGTLTDVLAAWSGEKPGILFIDALDAARGGPSERVFQHVIRSVQASAPSWRVVASIREFDLRYGVTYRDLFAGAPIDSTCSHAEFSKTRHLLIKRLSDEELEQLWDASKSLWTIFVAASPALRELLRSPFNLFLLSSILLSASDANLKNISTQVELLDRYWSYRVVDDDHRAHERERVLTAVVAAMVRDRSLTVGPDVLASIGASDTYDLFSRGVLSSLRARGDQVLIFGFSHHMLFDYAVARVLLHGGRVANFSTLVTEEDDLALLLAPGTVVALRMLWESDPDRSAFWQRSIDLASAGKVGAFCRMLPARVAAEATRSVADWTPALAALRGAEEQKREGIGFLVTHTIGVLTVRSAVRERLYGPTAGPWIAILRRVVECDAVGNLRFVRPFFQDAMNHTDLLTDEQQSDINVLGRQLLDSALQNEIDSFGIAASVTLIARTFSADPEASAAALRRLLKVERVTSHGHSDLLWLGQEAKGLASQGLAGVETVRDIYRAAFAVPLPSADKQTQMGGRILSLISNERQDFETSRYVLAERFEQFAVEHPVYALEALIDAVDQHSKEDELRDESKKVRIDFGGTQAWYQADNSAFWSDYNKGDAVVLVRHFKAALRKIALAEHDDVLKRIVSEVVAKNKAACIWVTLMEVGAEFPSLLGIELAPLLENEELIGSLDGRKASGDLISSVFGRLSSIQRTRIESAILRCRSSTQQVLLSCTPKEALVSERAIARRSELETKEELRPNEAALQMSSWTESIDRDWWLREQGVDVDVEANRSLYESYRSLEEATTKARNESVAQHLTSLWAEVLQLVDRLDAEVFPEALAMGAWSAVANAADVVALSCKSADDLSAYDRLGGVIEACLRDECWPKPVDDAEAEQSFAHSPSWSSPSPRIGAAQALMALIRAKGAAGNRYGALIRTLAVDPRPEIRFHILSRANLLYQADRQLMRELVELGLSREQNPGVISGLLGACARVLGDRPAWFSARLVELLGRVGDDGDWKQVRTLLTQATMTLCLWHDDVESCRRMHSWARDPERFEECLSHALVYLRPAVTMGAPGESTDREKSIRRHTIEFIGHVTAAALDIAKRKWTMASPTDADRATLTIAIKTLDAVATQLYFGSGAYDAKHPSEQTRNSSQGGPRTARRFLDEFGSTLEMLAEAPWPAITHHLLETLEAFIDTDPERVFRIAMTALNKGGKTAGYQFEHLGIQLFDRIVRRYLADYRSLIAENLELRRELMAGLDTFVECGWPEARELVYELPEMLR